MTAYKIERRHRSIALPATGHEPNHRAVSVWSHSDEATLRRFRQRSLDGGLSVGAGLVAVEVVLIHRPDNTYNANAVSVAMPARFGGSIHDRHLGYLYDSYLRRVGMTRLPDLAGLGTCPGRRRRHRGQVGTRG